MKADYFSFTVDAWSSAENTHSILGVTIHFLDANMMPKFFQLCTSAIKNAHTGENMSAIIVRALEEYGIPNSKLHVVVRDSESAMSKAVRLCGMPAIHCTAHKLQLVRKL